MSATIELSNTIANLPEIERGYAFNFTADAKKGERLLYTNKKTVFVRSLEDFTKSRTFVGEHKGNVKVAVSSPNGEWVASGDVEGRMIIWGQSNYSIKSDFPVNKCINDISWDADGKRLVCAGSGSGGMARAIAWDTGSALGSLMGHLKPLLSADYRKVRPYRIATGGEDNKVGFFEGPPFKPSPSGGMKPAHSNYINKLRYSPDGEFFATCSSDKTIQIWEGKTAEKVKTLEGGHTGSVFGFAWSPDSKKILSSSGDKTACIWDVETGAVEHKYTMGDQLEDQQMGCVWMGEHLISVSLSGAFNFLDAAGGDKPKSVVVGHAQDITGIVVDRATSAMYTTDAAGKVSVWVDSVATWFTGQGHGKGIRGVALSHDGSKLATVGADDTLRIHATAARELSDVGTPLGGAPKCVCFGTQTDVVVAGTSKSNLIIVTNGNTCPTALPQVPCSVAFNKDETKLAVGLEKGGVQVYNWVGGELTLDYEMKELTKAVRKVQWSPCGAYLVCSGDNKQVLVYQGAEQKNPTDWEYHHGMVTDHCFSPSGGMVASVASDLNIILWQDVVKWGTKRTKVDMAHRDGIKFVEFLNDETLVTVGGDCCMKMWKITP